MRLWTIQPIEVWRELQKQPIHAADPSRGSLSDFQEAYAWMRGQMAKRVPKYGGGPLWWAYHYKPDLRYHRQNYLPQEHIRLEIDVAEDEVLLSDMDAWNIVLNRQYCPVSEQDDEAFDARLEAAGFRLFAFDSYPPEFRVEIERSWERIFTPEVLWTSNDPPYLQATFEWLRLADVRRVTYFVGSYMPKYYGPKAIGPDDLPPIEGFGDTIRVGDRFQAQSIWIATGQSWDDGVMTLCGYECKYGRPNTVYVLHDDGSAGSFSLGGRKNSNFVRRLTLLTSG